MDLRQQDAQYPARSIPALSHGLFSRYKSAPGGKIVLSDILLNIDRMELKEMAEMKRRNLFFGIIILLAMFFVSLAIKYNDIKNNEGIENIEASFHSLLIAKSMNERSISEHHLLPIVTQYGKNNNEIPWGAAVRDNVGGYIYTSFPGIGFILPALFIKIFNLDYSLMSLFAFNSLVLLLTLFVTYLFLIRVFNVNRSFYYAVAALSCAPLILSRESLAATGLIYWPQSLSQLFIAIFLLSSCERIKQKGYIWLVVAGLAIYLLTMAEWTGYVLGGLSLIYFFFSKKSRDVKFSLTLVISLTAAVATYVAQIYLSVDFHDFISTSIARFSARSGGNANFLELITGYWYSFASFLIVIPLYLFLKIKNKDNHDEALKFSLLAALFLLAENIALAQHATSYTFDRLKMSFLLAIMISYVWHNVNAKLNGFLLAIISISVIISVYQYRIDVKEFDSWKDIQQKNLNLIGQASNDVNWQCSVIYSDMRVRAYLNLITGRSVWERLPTPEEMKSNAGCPVVIISGDMPYKDLQRISSISIYRGGNVQKIIK